jgi:hypothetical protein
MRHCRTWSLPHDDLVSMSCPVIVLSGLTGMQRRQLMLADNRIA